MSTYSENQDKGIRIAKKTAKKSLFKQHRLGAVIVKGSRILSTGFNQRRYTKELKQPTLHAEADAILKLLKSNRLEDLAGSTLYVSRFTAGGAVGCSKPCEACQRLIESVGIRKVVYTTDFNTTESYKI